jgi:Dolichyl-phosphate-mannose-protein mannosyltransferase
MPRMRHLARRHWLFGIVLACAIAVRVLVMLAFRPIMWFGGDSASYLSTALRLTPDPSRVGGYGFVLFLLKPLHSLVVVAAVQHAMGVAIGVLIYLLVRRYGLPGWAGTLAALPVFFDAYQLQLEQDVVPDVTFAFLVVVAVFLVLWWPNGSRSERRLIPVAGAGLALGLSAIMWPVGLALLLVLLVALLIWALSGGAGARRAGRLAGMTTVAAALVCGAVPVLGYAAWFDVHEHQFTLTRSDGVFLWSRTMSFADCAAIKPPADELPLCPPAGPRIASSLYIWDGNSPLLRMPGGRFSARTNALALNFALRAIAAQPGGYAAAVGHDLMLSFYWNRPVHPDAGIVDRYQFADANTAWVPASMGTPGGSTVARDQAAYQGGAANGGTAAPTRAVGPFASWLVSYQKWIYLRGTLLGLILLAGLAIWIARLVTSLVARSAKRPVGAGLPWFCAVTILVVPPLTADFDLRYLVPAVPLACLAAALACAPGQRTWMTSPAATATRAGLPADGDNDTTTSLPSESTSQARPDST